MDLSNPRDARAFVVGWATIPLLVCALASWTARHSRGWIRTVLSGTGITITVVAWYWLLFRATFVRAGERYEPYPVIFVALSAYLLVVVNKSFVRPVRLFWLSISALLGGLYLVDRAHLRMYLPNIVADVLGVVLAVGLLSGPPIVAAIVYVRERRRTQRATDDETPETD
jgi:hypothetical protein